MRRWARRAVGRCGVRSATSQRRDGDRLLQQRLVLRSAVRDGRVEQRPEVERRQRSLEARARAAARRGTRRALRWSSKRAGLLVGRGGRGHGEGVDDLRGGGGIFGVDLIEKGQHIAKEGVGVVDGQPGMEAVEGGMVGRGAEQGQADVPAHEQIGGKVPFQRRIGTGVGPGTDDFGTNQGADGIGGRRPGPSRVVVVAARSDNGGRIVALGEAHEGVGGAVDEERLDRRGRSARRGWGRESGGAGTGRAGARRARTWSCRTTGNARIAIPTALLVTERDVKHPDHATNAGGCRFGFRASRSHGIMQSSPPGLRQSPGLGTPMNCKASCTEAL